MLRSDPVDVSGPVGHCQLMQSAGLDKNMPLRHDFWSENLIVDIAIAHLATKAFKAAFHK
jgi:hypothetical protein